MAIEVQPLTPLIGATISGVNLSRVDEPTFEQIKTAFLKHLVVFFRDQDISLEEHIAFGRRFGDLHVHPANGDYQDTKNLPPEILRIHADETTKRTAGDKWHSDVSCDPEPPAASILRLTTLPPQGGDTLFANMYAAYDALSSSMKKMLEGLTATHDGGPNYRDRARRNGIDMSHKQYPRNSHPIVRTHPETGRKALYVNCVFTQSIDDIPEDESDAILNFLYQHSCKAMFQCRFQWKVNSVAMWDNRCAMHHAIWDYYPQVRTGQRVTVKGDRPR
ncbi:MAG: TauD/TfdA family dioxygenase [Burkholderiaceae bacterium]